MDRTNVCIRKRYPFNKLRLLGHLLILATLYLAFLNCSVQSADASIEKLPTLNLVGDGLEFSSEVIDGVQARILISDVRSDMKKLGSAKTHLMAVRFYNTADDTPIPQGHAALYLTNDHTKNGFFDPMKNQDGIFVAGLLLIKPGDQHAIIATKLIDEKTRDFHVNFTLE
ncbi:MAG: hypothetical protein C0624_10430 [Desulfuromonas sp.]|nr:MAG: hypothetical protein C0624_10430 [Desulfuromonas sp.]